MICELLLKNGIADKYKILKLRRYEFLANSSIVSVLSFIFHACLRVLGVFASAGRVVGCVGEGGAVGRLPQGGGVFFMLHVTRTGRGAAGRGGHCGHVT